MQASPVKNLKATPKSMSSVRSSKLMKSQVKQLVKLFKAEFQHQVSGYERRSLESMADVDVIEQKIKTLMLPDLKHTTN